MAPGQQSLQMKRLVDGRLPLVAWGSLGKHGHIVAKAFTASLGLVKLMRRGCEEVEWPDLYQT